MRLLQVICVCVFGLNASLAIAAPAKTPEWTLMVYMNAKNNLEPDALENFNEMANRGSTPDVNILVQMGRPLKHTSLAAESWSGVLRFRVAKDQEPVPSQAVVDLRGKPELSDLGSVPHLIRPTNTPKERHVPASCSHKSLFGMGRGRQIVESDPRQQLQFDPHDHSRWGREQSISAFIL